MQRFGKFEVVREIGAGGFGKVYEGFDPTLQRRVAIKTCLSQDARVRARFEREALIVAGLQHPNITTVHDLGSQDGVPFLVQEYLTGADLSELIARGKDLSLRERLQILIQVARGMEYAHQQGIVHRDVKPANIRVLDDGSVKVMDFGIAKVEAYQTKLTRTGTLVGTAAYLAPEQIEGEELDGRCDIFAFGVVCFELLTLRRPFAAETMSKLLYAILHYPAPPLRDAWPGAPAGVARLVDACLAKDREQRPASFGEVRERLEQELLSVEPTRVLGSDELPTVTAATPRTIASRSTSPTALSVGSGPDDVDDVSSFGPVAGSGSRRAWVVVALAVIAVAVLGGGVWLVAQRDRGLPRDLSVEVAAAPAVTVGETTDIADDRPGPDADTVATQPGAPEKSGAADPEPPNAASLPEPRLERAGSEPPPALAETGEADNRRPPFPADGEERSFPGRRPGADLPPRDGNDQITDQDRQQIRHLLEAFALAYQERELFRLKRLFPSIPQPMIARLRRQPGTETISVARERCSMERERDTTELIAVTCPVLRTFETPSGDTRESRGEPTFVVRRVRLGWVIDHLERFDDGVNAR